jgi:hypothetical protein
MRRKIEVDSNKRRLRAGTIQLSGYAPKEALPNESPIRKRLQFAALRHLGPPIAGTADAVRACRRASSRRSPARLERVAQQWP